MIGAERHDAVALYHFDGGAGLVLVDATGGNNGQGRVGGGPVGPLWSTHRPPW